MGRGGRGGKEETEEEVEERGSTHIGAGELVSDQEVFALQAVLDAAKGVFCQQLSMREERKNNDEQAKLLLKAGDDERRHSATRDSTDYGADIPRRLTRKLRIHSVSSASFEEERDKAHLRENDGEHHRQHEAALRRVLPVEVVRPRLQILTRRRDRELSLSVALNEELDDRGGLGDCDGLGTFRDDDDGGLRRRGG